MITFVEPTEVVNLRARIAEMQADLEALRTVPLSDGEVSKRIDQMVETHAMRGNAPRILGYLIHGGTPPVVDWPLDHEGRPIQPSPFDLLCALSPERARADLRALVAASTHPRGAAPAERAKRTKRLQEELLTAEREEEALIVALAAQGINVHRRPDVNPAIVLET